MRFTYLLLRLSIYLSSCNQSKVKHNVHNRGMKVIDNNQKQHSKGLSWKNVRFNLRDLCFTDRMRWFVYRITRGTNQGSILFLQCKCRGDKKNNHINPHSLKLHASEIICHKKFVLTNRVFFFILFLPKLLSLNLFLPRRSVVG